MINRSIDFPGHAGSNHHRKSTIYLIGSFTKELDGNLVAGAKCAPAGPPPTPVVCPSGTQHWCFVKDLLMYGLHALPQTLVKTKGDL